MYTKNYTLIKQTTVLVINTKFLYKLKKSIEK